MWKMLMTLGIEEKLNAELEIYKAECAQLKARNEELQQRSKFLASAGLGAKTQRDLQFSLFVSSSAARSICSKPVFRDRVVC